ncbi:MAG: polyprenol monophosphomannose synthase [Saprospiraceae bacterium]
MSDSIVIIPTYNEKENIENIIRAVFSLEKAFHVLVVEDNSPDGTADIVKRLIKEEFSGRLFIEERKGKLGLGTAYIHGFRWSLKRGYEYTFEMDADFSHSPKDLERLYAACVNGADMSVGSRYVKGGKLENWPIDRILLSYGASVYVRLVTWIPVKDSTAGFVCYTKRVLEAIDFDKIRFVGYAFQIEMKFATHTLGFKIKEIPITFTDRVEGTSKMSQGIVKEAIMGVIRMKTSYSKGKYANN